MPRTRSQVAVDHGDNLALILLDYDNLIDSFGEGASQKRHNAMLGMVLELRRYLSEELRVKPVRTVAYGDFGAHGEDAATVMTDLAATGVEARHVPSGLQTSDASTSLTIHATELLHHRADLSAFVILSGNNWYVPLTQHLQRFGKFVLVAALDLPQQMDHLCTEVADAFLNARFLLKSVDRDSLPHARQREDGPADPGEAQERAPKETSRVEDPGAFHALELIEEYFGQYEEVYLTPLLRKMSELLGEEDGEPKDNVNLLQDAGVVWLEKRRGFPYDYTVLMVNEAHPDVVDVRDAARSGSEFGDDGYDRPYPNEDLMEGHEYQDNGA